MFQNDIEKAIESVMPVGAEILLSPNTAHYEAHISWKLDNEEARRNKRSRTIILKVSREAVADYPALSDGAKKMVINNMGSYLKKKYITFVQEDKENVLPLSETWDVDENILGMLG